MKVKIKKLHRDATLPVYATQGSACFDLSSVEEGTVGITTLSRIFATGLAIEVPEGHVMFIYSRSGHAYRNDIRLANCVGVIDSDYRGEIMVKLTSDANTLFDVLPGDRIAQACILPIEQVQFQWADELGKTVRGIGGFGSTGIRANEGAIFSAPIDLNYDEDEA